MRQWAKWPGAGTLLCMVVALESLPRLNAEQLRELAGDLIAQIAQHSQQISIKDKELHYRQAKIEQLTHEMAVFKRLANSAAVASTSMPARPACSMRPSTPTSQRSSKNCKIWHPQPRPALKPAINPNAQRCPRNCPAWNGTTSLNPPPVGAAANSNASAKTSASVWTTHRAC